MNQLRTLVDVWRAACADFAAVARSLSDTEWRLPTDLPGWSVGDVVAHCAALESELAGDEPLRVEIDKSAPHITGPRGIYTERGVVARRGRTPEQVIAEFEDAVERRTAMLAAEPLDDPDAIPAITPGRSGWNWAILLRNRPIDIWVHEQDVRRAVGKPGDLDTTRPLMSKVSTVRHSPLWWRRPPCAAGHDGRLRHHRPADGSVRRRGGQGPSRPASRRSPSQAEPANHARHRDVHHAGRRTPYPSSLPVRAIAGATAPEGLADRILSSLNISP